MQMNDDKTRMVSFKALAKALIGFRMWKLRFRIVTSVLVCGFVCFRLLPDNFNNFRLPAAVAVAVGANVVSNRY